MRVGSRIRRLAVILVLALAWSAAPSAAWLVVGHRIITLDAVAALPETFPPFFTAGAVAVAEASVDPDLHRPRELAQLRNRETPEHYLDLELLEERAIPSLRSEHLRLVAWLAAEPGGGRVRDIASVGTLPYSVTEGLQRLTVAFAEYRRWPDDPHIRAKILVYAGLLAHYAGDLCQPLHTTLHHDGRSHPDGTSPRTGIHRRVDALPTAVPLDRAAIVAETRLVALSDGFADVVAELLASHAFVDRVYELEGDLPTAEDGRISPDLAAFATERYAASVRFIGSLFLTAWEDSATFELPDWLQRSSSR